VVFLLSLLVPVFALVVLGFVGWLPVVDGPVGGVIGGVPEGCIPGSEGFAGAGMPVLWGGGLCPHAERERTPAAMLPRSVLRIVNA
jgi:hypothetical protein